MNEPQLIINPDSQLVTVSDASPTISVQWDRAVQQAVINAAVGPTVASRAYGILHTAMYDAWSAYDLEAIATQLADDLQRPNTESTIANKTEAMSFAAYRVLSELFPSQQALFDTLLTELGFNANNTTTDTSTAAGIGNVSAEALMQFRRNDGSNQLNGYADNTDYAPINSNHNNIVDLEKWTAEYVPIESPNSLQSFLTPQWSVLTPFALESPDALRPVAPEPFLLVEGATVNLDAGTITLADSSVVNISADIVGNAGDEGAIINQGFIDQSERIVAASANLTDKQKLIAEFWEDGGGTSFPPGTWMTFGQFVSARENNSIDEDALLFLSLANAVFDAGIATWEAKVAYDYARPVRTIRELGRLGLLNGGRQGTDAITGQTGYVIDAWAGPGLGTQTILAENFITYQTPGRDPSPPFAEYTSGHSSFSASGAEILRAFTGSDTFGASVTFQAGESRFESTLVPLATTTLNWDTFSEAADEAGLSRIYGGIHFDDGDLNARLLGREVGAQVWDKTRSLFTGADLSHFEFTVDELSDHNSLYLFTVDDSDGSIDGLRADDEGYLESAMARSNMLFSALPDNADFVTRLDAVNSLSVLNDSYLSFLSMDEDRQFSFSETTWVDDALNDFSLNVGSFTVQAQAVDDDITGQARATAQVEVLDLTNLTGSVEVTFQLQREASFNNIVGFYVVDDLTGQVTDAEGNTLAAAATADYVRAALDRRVSGLALSGCNNRVTTMTEMLEAGKMLAPFLVVDGTIEALLDENEFNDPTIYFPFLGANTDGADHVRLFGKNTFGFEDLAGGGDQDFDDVVLRVEFA